MQEKRKTIPKKRLINERRADMRQIRTSVSQKEIYLWALSLVLMSITLTSFVFTGIINNM